jgi:hypothetical protein
MRTLLDTQAAAKPAKQPVLSKSGFPMSYIDDLAKRRARINKLKDKMYARIDNRNAG